MQGGERKFLRQSVIAFNRRHRAVLGHNIRTYEEAVARGKKRHARYGEFRDYAARVKEGALGSLADHLEEFERRITARGARVYWARSAEQVLEIAGELLTRNQARLVVKSKSMITEETGFNEEAPLWNCEVVETDLGEFIVQTAGEKPYHILTPAMHKSKEDVAQLFREKFGTAAEATPAEIAAFVRRHLRRKFAEAHASITGANFIVADIGGIGLTENEGNGLMTVSTPDLHIVIAGIERVIPEVRDLPFFFQWVALHGTGQQVSAYNTLLMGPRASGEKDGPREMVVILLDNGRSRLLAQGEEQAALRCIRCGACLNACPIYRNVGGYTYGSVYTGPVGSVITPFYEGFRAYGHLSYACTVCGRCSEVCPVKIPLHELLLLNRQQMHQITGGSPLWNGGMKAYRYLFARRSRLDRTGGRTKNRLMTLLPSPAGKGKKMPRFANRSFSAQWKTLNN